MLRAIPLALATLGLLGATGVAAQGAPQGLNYRLGLGLDHSDNMARRPVAVADTDVVDRPPVANPDVLDVRAGRTSVVPVLWG